ncbi:MAG TPA: decaprenyl-phosphate phosphoribosyltransferase [Brevefilum fermentans]|jgi:4-hydroxybenzoate polyprenyltransferase|uniref:Putative prenyltransferase n=1 Tax=Candidatus Brevifilum fermentans TaxID=1986204 RepID=A0A1Y6K5A3_9CHLR|nr:decaprenyl-phosphate phosphoribosyltransferase [Brevefilum fermentans]OQB83392.1 MAG: Decaprenyl-phosphate phosphoribosyltransferase [Chloroflexi bacterium ADurb.Bin120]SMX54756.1 putative prenyltransferase [Brevefilum fermentans]HOM66437.1 decaprenyl-phosphate phosphoribosyltransferase [Brevefilum fermentans]HQA28091.1 decaprenyl-phosphate phosphoribosyltransferase [Brevefilum fermentans]
MSNQLHNIVKTMRPKQWLKNVFVFAGLVFDRQLFSLASFLLTLAAAFLFCLASSMIYIINDLVDIEFDRQHPIKKHRPLASGALSQRSAIIALVMLGLFTFPAAFFLNTALGWIIAAYFILMLAYSLWLKHIALIDVMIIAAGFVLRVAAGVMIIETERFSPWLVVATVFLALFIGLGKRRSEIELLNTQAPSHRRVLNGYTLELLDQLLTIVLSATLMTYCLYTFSTTNTPDSYHMMFTIPFVIYGLFRYLYLVRIENSGGTPEDIVVSDRPMQAAILLWGITVVVILYWL